MQGTTGYIGLLLGTGWYWVAGYWGNTAGSWKVLGGIGGGALRVLLGVGWYWRVLGV